MGGNPTYLMFRIVTCQNVCFPVTLLSFPAAARGWNYLVTVASFLGDGSVGGEMSLDEKDSAANRWSHAAIMSSGTAAGVRMNFPCT